MTRRGIAGRLRGRAHQVFVRLAFQLFERFLPVREDYWCFSTWDRYWHTLDNPRAVFEEIKSDPSVKKIVLQKTASEVEDDAANTEFIAAETVRGAYYLARSGVILTGYAVRATTSYSRWLRRKRHVVVQLWHGIPLKRIGHLFPQERFWEAETVLYDATVCSSSGDREVMARAFSPLPHERVWQTGLPRNDLITKPERHLPRDYQRQLAELDLLVAGRRLVLYAPTWREREESLYSFSLDEEEALQRTLQDHDAVLAIRGHANVRKSAVYTGGWKNGCIISVDEFPDVNMILRRSEVLITDYSSIYIDFLLLDRPIIHFIYDFDDYLKERGLLYDIDTAFGGLSAESFDRLLPLLGQALRNQDCGARQRRQAAELFHEHPDNSAGEVVRRISALIGRSISQGS